MKNRLTGILFLLTTAPCVAATDDWPQWRGANRDGVWREDGIVSSFTADSLKVLWRQPVGSGYSGPTVANGRVFVMDRHARPEQIEGVLCFDEKTGKPLWSHTYPATYTVGYPAGPRASVTVEDDRAYALGTMGHMHCLSAETGEVVWTRDLNAEYAIASSRRMPIWGISASPLIYDDLVILHISGADGACIVGLDKMTGRERWRALDDRGQYSSPVLVRQNDRDVVVCWTGDSVAGIDPLAGSVYWRFEFKPKEMPIGVATPVVRGDRVFFTSFYDGSLMLRLKKGEMGVEQVWLQCGPNEQNTRALQSIISTPVWIEDHIYGVDSHGELRCLNAATGERVWEDLSAVPRARWSTIHFVQNGDQTWMFNERGELILGKLTPSGFTELSRAPLISPTTAQLRDRNGVCWSHPAFANRCVFLRNDKEMICVSLAK